jgi:hypothetical protein
MASIGDILARVYPGKICRLTDGVWRRLNELHAATGTGPTGGGVDPMPGPGADP